MEADHLPYVGLKREVGRLLGIVDSSGTFRGTGLNRSPTGIENFSILTNSLNKPRSFHRLRLAAEMALGKVPKICGGFWRFSERFRIIKHREWLLAPSQHYWNRGIKSAGRHENFIIFPRIHDRFRGIVSTPLDSKSSTKKVHSLVFSLPLSSSPSRSSQIVAANSDRGIPQNSAAHSPTKVRFSWLTGYP